MDISLVIVTDGAHLDNLSRAINSVSDIVEEKVLVYQGRDKDVYAKIAQMADFSTMLSYKGNADPDRNFAYSLPGKSWILSLDDDEWVPYDTKKEMARLLFSKADVIWFKFENKIDGVDMSEILGDDPHPRLWRKRDMLINWPAQAHTYPQIASSMQYFSLAPIVHDRAFVDVERRHSVRGRNIDPRQQEVEHNFMEAVKKKLGKK